MDKHRWRKLASYVAACLLTCGLSACFQMREPEQPQASTGWTTPTEPDVLLSNFAGAVSQVNLINYERCFAPEPERERFTFLPDPVIGGANAGLFARWTLQEELEYFKNIANRINATTNNRLLFTDERRSFFTADSLEYTANYDLLLYHTDTSFAQYNYKGRTILVLVRRPNNEWFIRSWQDNKTGTEPCWTELKQYFFAP